MDEVPTKQAPAQKVVTAMTGVCCKTRALLCRIDWRGIFSQARDIFLHPRTVWSILVTKDAPPRSIYLQYLLPLAALGPLAQYIKMLTFGEAIVPVGRVRWGILAGLGATLSMFLMGLLLVAVASVIVQLLAPRFGGKLNFPQATKLMAYTLTPAFAIGIFNIIPGLGLLPALCGLYGLYLFWLALPVFSGVPNERQGAYFSLSVACTFCAMLVISLLLTSFTKFP